MNIKDVIKALDHCSENGYCTECILKDSREECNIMKYALVLIKKLQAKNKRLEEENKRLKYFLEEVK